jgi:photosystem II reaction center protein PsbP
MSIKTIAFAIIPLLLLLVSNTLASAQTTAAAVIAAAITKTYENSQYGFRILYPANWNIAPRNTLHSMEFLYYGTNTVIAFVAPIGTFLDIDKHTFLTISVIPVEKSLDKKDLKVKPKSLDDIVSDKIKFLSSSGASIGSSSDIRREILRTNSTTVGGNPAKQIQYITHFSGLADTFNIDTNMIRGDKLYTLIFTTGSFLVPKTLPTAQKMIHSFQFTS